MPSPANRAPLLLALVVVLGVGGRFLRDRWERSTVAPVHQDALDRQLARVERAALATRGRAARGAVQGDRQSTGAADATGAAGTRRASARTTPSPRQRPVAKPPMGRSADAVRSERTPVGAIPPNVLAKYLASTGRSGELVGDGMGTVRSVESNARGVRDRARSQTIVDVDVASEPELERLPRIGPALARRIVEDRKARGPFRSLEGLQRVRGVGPATARLLEGRVTFGGTGRP